VNDNRILCRSKNKIIFIQLFLGVASGANGVGYSFVEEFLTSFPQKKMDCLLVYFGYFYLLALDLNFSHKCMVFWNLIAHLNEMKLE